MKKFTNPTWNKWWGYIHVDGSIHAKRYFDEDQIKEAEESPFVKDLVGPFPAENKDDAIDVIRHRARVMDQIRLKEIMK